MTVPQYEFYPEPRTEALMVAFRIISRRSWDELQSWHEACPGSTVEHVQHGVYVLHVRAGGTKEVAG